MEDRRRGTRHTVDWPARVAHRELGAVYGRIVNMAVGGVLITVPAQLTLNDMVELEIAVNPSFTIRCAVRVVREQPLGPASWAYGAEFKQLPAADAERLLETLLELAPAAEDSGLSYRPARVPPATRQ